jgi:hypothetical protein
MITRDLLAPTSAPLGKAIDPATLSSMRVGGASTTPRLPGTMTSLPTGAKLDLSGLRRRVRIVILVAVVTFVGICGLGLAALIPAVMDAADKPASAPTAPSAVPSFSVPPGPVTNLHSVAGWNALVAAIKSASGSTSVYDLVVYPEYAAVGLDGDGAVERRFYRDGGWQESVSVRTPAVGALVDLGDIDPAVISHLPDETASHFGIDEPSGTYIIINAIMGGPRILVYVQTSDGGSQYRAYGLDGRAIG